jgi:hypothetical protein
MPAVVRTRVSPPTRPAGENVAVTVGPVSALRSALGTNIAFLFKHTATRPELDDARDHDA